jgi:cellulase
MVQELVLAALAAALPLAVAQQIGTYTPEVHPNLTTYECTLAGGCTATVNSVVLDFGYRYLHVVGGYASCYAGSGLNQTLCGTEEECYENCAIEGVDYATSGIVTDEDSITLNQFVTSDGTTSSASPRAYLLGDNGDYVNLQLNGKEISFTVDVSNLPCGENGALYLSEMSNTGGRTQYNPGAANYGSGYCDAQCGVDTWFNGSVNTDGARSCCNEMDLWEANANATALTPHPCSATTCDPDGCGLNPYGQGLTTFYGVNGDSVNTLEPFTVVTQFYTSDNTTTGTLTQISRLYVQNGKVIPEPVSPNTGLNSITASWCDSSDSAAASLGGLTTMGEALESGMVLIFSIWNDAGQYMNWLDSGSSGPCSSTAGDPTLIQQQDPGTSVTWSNIRWGDIGSTYLDVVSSVSSSSSTTKTTSASHTSTSPPTTTTSSPAQPTQSEWGQCAGIGYTGPTVCATPYVCTYSNPYYSQCLVA